MLRGFATVSYYAADLDAAAAWYSEVLGIEPYFKRPGYIEFRVGDYEHELGIIDAQYRPPMPDGPGGEIIQWHVDDLPGCLRAAARSWCHVVPAAHRARTGLRDRGRRRPVRQHPRRHVQPALPRHLARS